MGNLHICAPTATAKSIHATTCLDCKKRTRIYGPVCKHVERKGQMKISELIGQLCEIEHKEGNIEVDIARATKRGGLLQSAVTRVEIDADLDMHDEKRVRLYYDTKSNKELTEKPGT